LTAEKVIARVQKKKNKKTLNKPVENIYCRSISGIRFDQRAHRDSLISLDPHRWISRVNTRQTDSLNKQPRYADALSDYAGNSPCSMILNGASSVRVQAFIAPRTHRSFGRQT